MRTLHAERSRRPLWAGSLGWLLAGLASLGACGSSATSPMDPLPPDNAMPTGGFFLAFAADFVSGGTCGDEPTGALGGAGCDIYRARLDSAFQPITVGRLTQDPVPEVFPSIQANGASVAFHTLASTTARSLVWVDAATSARIVLSDSAQYPEILPDGSRLLFTDLAAGSALVSAPFSAGGTTLGSRTALGSAMPAQDVNVAADGIHAVFHVPGTAANHGVYWVNLSVSPAAPQPVTQQSGIGHCTISPTGSRVVCDDANGRGLAAWAITPGSGNSISVSSQGTIVSDPSNLSASDADYAGCGTTSVDFPSFCDDTHLAVSVSCVSLGSGIRFSKVFLADLNTSPATLQPLGATLASRVGGAGKTSWTPSCRAAR